MVIWPITERERLFQDALHDMEARTCVQKEAISEIHAAIIWGGMYVDRAQKQLQSTRKKRNLRNQKLADERWIAKGDTFSSGWLTMRSRQGENWKGAENNNSNSALENGTARVATLPLWRETRWSERWIRRHLQGRRPEWTKPKLGKANSQTKDTGSWPRRRRPWR